MSRKKEEAGKTGSGKEEIKENRERGFRETRKREREGR
jgi:hypothetical protein